MNLLNQEERAKMIEDIKKPFNIDRKAQSLYRSDVQKDKMKPFVLDELKKQLMDSSVREMPIISTVNIQKRVVTKKSCVYTEGVTRTFEGASDVQIEILEEVYEDGKADIELHKCNKKLTYEHQTILGILPRKKKLVFKKFELHQVDAFPSMTDPESMGVIVLSVFNREDVEMTQSEELNTATGAVPHKDRFQGDKPAEDSDIASQESYKKGLERYIVWSHSYNFMMDGHGQVFDTVTGEVIRELSIEDINNPLSEFGLIPFVDISREKDGSFWNDNGSSLSDFTVQFNVALSDIQTNAKFNGYAMGVLKAPSSFNPQGMTVGPNTLLHLPTDNPDEDVDFEFVTPSSNIGEISDAADKLLNYFITTEDLDSSVINSTGAGQKFASGFDRFLALTEKREATKEDYAIFKAAEEEEIFPVVKAWLNVLSGTDTLDKKYHIGNLSDDVIMKAEFNQSTAILTDKEKIENIKVRKELGLETKVTMLMKLDGMSEQEATEHLELINRTLEEELPEVPEPEIEEETEEEEVVEGEEQEEETEDEE